MPHGHKHFHEIRDPIHVFVRLDSEERSVLDSRPVQRLRHIHQLALSSFVYPGATHKRFEHSLGVMELAGRVFDRVTDPSSAGLFGNLRGEVPELGHDDTRRYWRRVIRLAALCHDVGHLPFSHAAERELLPEGWDHERLTREILTSAEMRRLFEKMTPPVRAEDVIKLAVGPKKASDLTFSNCEALLSEIIVGDAFGVDRIDYLLRDSYHLGVAYGRFDHFRLVDTLCILPSVGTDDQQVPAEPVLGIEEGGIQSAEALLIARYLMYSQVYFHPVRRAYDLHLKDFLKAWLDDGHFGTDVDTHLARTDNEVLTALSASAWDSSKRGHTHARRLLCRQHFRVLYQRNPTDHARNVDALSVVYRATRSEFGAENVRMDHVPVKGSLTHDFPVLTRDGQVESSLAVSDALNHLPTAAFGYVFIAAEHERQAKEWLTRTREQILRTRTGGNGYE